MNPKEHPPARILVRCEDVKWDVGAVGPEALTEAVLNQPMRELAPPGAEVSVLYVTDKRIRQLNRDYRKIDSPTDVLAFALNDEPEDDMQTDETDIASPSASETILGDIVISLETAKRQAAQRDATPTGEIALLLIHGLLHLLGHDHAEKEEEQTMQAIQAEWLKHQGFAHP